MTNGISDISKFKSMEKMTQSHQKGIDQSRKKIASGYKYSSYSDLARDNNLRDVTLRKAEISKLNNNYNGLLKIKNFMEATDLQLESLIEVTTRFKTILISKNSLAGNSIDLTARANEGLQDVQRVLSHKHNGQYIFAGTKTDRNPLVDDLIKINNIIENQVTDNYYRGNGNKLSINVNYNIEYSITGNHLSFQNLIGALNFAKTPSLISQSGKILDLSIMQLIDLRAQFGHQIVRVEHVIEKNKQMISNNQLKLAEILETDILDESTKLSQSTLALEASYRLISSTKDLSLSKFL